jgi:copper transport protein
LARAAAAIRSAIARWCSALSLVGVGAALAASGHAAAAAPEVVTRPALFLHAVCVAFWLGALLPLAATLGSDRKGLARFSKAIPLPFFVLIMTGLLLAIVQVRELEALWTTSYGLILSGKLGGVCVLLGLAGLNRWLTPRVMEENARAARQLRRSIIAEVAIMGLILALVASWRFTPPPRALLTAAGQPVHAHIHTDRAMVDLQFEKTSVESRRIKLTLLDGRFAPLPAKEVVLVLSKPDAGIEALRLTAWHVDGTTWQVDDVRLPLPGSWHVQVEILISDFEKTAIGQEIDLSK